MTQAQIEEFFGRLEGPEGCDFRSEGLGEGGQPLWNCRGGNDKTFATAILKRMRIPDAEAVAFLRGCHGHGGHCDCEIIFNAAQAMLPDQEFPRGAA